MARHLVASVVSGWGVAQYPWLLVDEAAQGGTGGLLSLYGYSMAMIAVLLSRGFPYAADWRPRFAEAYRREMAAFVRVVRGEIASPCTARDAVAASRVADAAQRSLETGAPVRVEPLGTSDGAAPPVRRPARA